MQRPLSELIREGAKMHPQASSAYYIDGKTCALGAAAMAAGVMEIVPLSYSQHTWGHIDDQFAAISAMEIGKTIIELNDDGWTRERIADWLVTTNNDMMIVCKQIPVEKVLEISHRERELVTV